MNTQVNKPLAVLFLSMAFYGFGCGGQSGDQPSLGTVSGTVTMDGKPLSHADVVFMPTQGSPSSGQTDENGQYELSYVGDAKGALIAKHKVSITTGVPVSKVDGLEADLAASMDIGGDGGDGVSDRLGPAAKKEAIPAKYNSETTLSEEVVAGSNEIDFPLKSK